MGVKPAALYRCDRCGNEETVVDVPPELQRIQLPTGWCVSTFCSIRCFTLAGATKDLVEKISGEWE